MPRESLPLASERGPDAGRKNEIASEVARLLLDRGLTRVTLRSLAAAMGTSHRMLLYHFGSLDKLLAAAFERSRLDQLALVEATLDPSTPLSYQVRQLWTMFADPRAVTVPRTFFEMFGRALRSQGVLSEFAERSLWDWIDYMSEQLIGRGWERDAARTESTLTVAVFRGLLMDLLATGDRRRVEATLDIFLMRFESADHR